LRVYAKVTLKPVGLSHADLRAQCGLITGAGAQFSDFLEVGRNDVANINVNKHAHSLMQQKSAEKFRVVLPHAIPR
jgi:hypothetical protein